jgi:class 3 adenylate cyclase
MQAASNRTFICSVVFLDVVEYSKKPVAEQIQLKERLNGLLTEALANVAPNDRIILDTGDGAALSFLGDPEDALFVSLSLRDALAGPQPPGPTLRLRVGINLGPVKLVKDINGQPNIIGDGINVAQRVMSFSEPGQILVSRSYYEVVSCLSEGYVQLFHYEGARTDKHVREHEVYAVEATGAAFQMAVAAAPRSNPPVEAKPAVADKLSQSASFVAENLRRKPRVGTAIAVVAILTIAVGIRAGRQLPAAAPAAQPSTPPAKVASARPAKGATAAPAPAAKEAPKPVEAAKASKAGAALKPATTEKSDPPKSKRVAPKPAEKGVPLPAAPLPPPVVAKAPEPAAAKANPESKAQAAGAGTLLVTIRPWGEIYVDGRLQGEAPPLYELRIAAGKRRVEIRHPDFPPHARTVDVAAGARVEFRHVFLPKDQPNPFRRLLP